MRFKMAIFYPKHQLLLIFILTVVDNYNFCYVLRYETHFAFIKNLGFHAFLISGSDMLLSLSYFD